MKVSWTECPICIKTNQLPSPETTTVPAIKVLILLSDTLTEKNRAFLDRAIENASNTGLDSIDFSILDIVTCSCSKKDRVCSMKNPFKDTFSIKTKDLGIARERVAYYLDKVDPHIIIGSGMPAAKCLTVKSGYLKLFNKREVKEVEIKGHLIKVRRPIMLIPSISWLIQNFSRDPEGPTSHAVNIIRTAIKYSELRTSIIGE